MKETSRTKINNIPDSQFIKIIEQSVSYADCCRAIGVDPKYQKAINIIKERIDKLGIPFDHYDSHKRNAEENTIPLKEVLVEKSYYNNNRRLKKRLIDAGLLEYKCAVCGNSGQWNGKPLTLQLDHINENHLDNRLENLQFLCPNCHAQKTAGV